MSLESATGPGKCQNPSTSGLLVAWMGVLSVIIIPSYFSSSSIDCIVMRSHSYFGIIAKARPVTTFLNRIG